MASVTSANCITDATRTTNTQGDGATPPDSSYGIWEGTTNIVTNGGFETNTTGWRADSSIGTISRATGLSKFGSAHAEFALVAASDGFVYDYTPAGATTYTVSFWLRSVSGDTTVYIRAWDNVAGSQLTGALTLTSDWQRYTYTFTTGAACASGNIGVYNKPFGGSSTITFAIDGVQLEQKSVATPYVHTDGATAARSAASVQAPATILSTTQGWWATRVRAGCASTAGKILTFAQWGFLSGSETSITIYFQGGSFTTRRLNAGVVAAASKAVAFSTDDYITLVCYWTSANVAISVNGSAFTTGAGGTIPTIATANFYIGSPDPGISTSGQIDSAMLWFASGQGTLTDADAANIHAFGNSDPRQFAFPGDCTFFWGAQTDTYDSSRLVTASGNEITDYLTIPRGGTPTQGDGQAAPDSSFGIWEASTNLVTNGGFETNTTGWANDGVGTTIAQDATQFKFGSKSMKVVAAATNHGALRATNAISSATAYTYSALVNFPNGKAFDITAAGNVSGTTWTGAGTGSGAWQRVTVSFTTGASDTNVQLRVSNRDAAGQTFYVDGVQLEQKPIATPYVETDGATATRSAARVRAPASLLDETQGWVAIRTRMGWASASTPRTYSSPWGWGDSDLLKLEIIYQSGAGFYFIRRNTTADQVAFSNAAFSSGDTLTIICEWTATTLGGSLNGAAFTSAASTHIPALAAALFDIGSEDAVNLGREWDGDILWFACGVGLLTDADAATINGFGNNDPSLSSFPQTAQVTAVWKADDLTYLTPQLDGSGNSSQALYIDSYCAVSPHQPLPGGMGVS